MRLRTAFPLAFALLVACLGPGEGPIAQTVADLDGFPEHWSDGTIVEPEGHLGWTRGVFQVTADGAAAYDIPLWAPAGRAGIEPDLALHYSSRGGDSVVGVGWSITGLSSITRCGRTRTIDGDDPGPSPVRWDEATFCLEGQRLVPLTEAEQASIGGLANRLRPLQNGTESIEFIGPTQSPTEFIVHHDDGVAYHYEPLVTSVGCEASSDPARPFGVQTSDTTITYAWLLSRVDDLAGNYMTIAYEQVPHGPNVDGGSPQLATFSAAGCAPVEWHATSLNYTGNAAIPGRLGEPQRSVTLGYNRVGIEPSVRLVSGEMACPPNGAPNCPVGGVRSVGMVLATSQSLTGVTARGPHETLARNYFIEGTPSDQTHRRLVTVVRECAGSLATCREPLEFNYLHARPVTGPDLDLATAVPGGTGAYFPSTATLAPTSTVAHGDIDGDGTEELLMPNQALHRWDVVRLQPTPRIFGVTNVTDQTVLIPSDQDGDGRSDLLASFGSFGSSLFQTGSLILQPAAGGQPPTYQFSGTRASSITGCRSLPIGSTTVSTGAGMIGGGDLIGSGFRQHFVQCVTNTRSRLPGGTRSPGRG